ncbi:TldD/PmbA family protein [candidate division WOR-3 bacterium]|nr:TldD/PmbA family protein [candidate division WOR-3 bacterium]
MDEKKSHEILDKIINKGAQKSSLVGFQREITELNVEKDTINFLRSTKNNEIRIEAYCDRRKADLTLNNFNDEDIKKAAEQLNEMCVCSQPDDANDLCPEKNFGEFLGNASDPDPEKMTECFSEFLQEAKNRFPEVIFSDTTFAHYKNKITYANSNGSYIAEDRSFYNANLFFTSKREKDVSSFNYLYFYLKGLEGKIIEKSGIDILLKNSVEHLLSKPLKEKFRGDLLMTPKAALGMFDDFFYPLFDNRLIAGTSIYQDKLGEQIASPQLSIKMMPLSEKSVFKDYFTFDGFLTEDMDLVKDGILKNFLLSYYGSRKTGLPRAKNRSGNHIEIQSGEEDLESLVSGVQKGILLDRFSGGSPSVSGDISGVCKNSYCIENGKIKFPVKEVMLTANTAEMLMNISGISKETIDYGNSRAPYILVKDVSFS